MFGISGLHRQNAQTNLVTNKTMKNYKKTGVQILWKNDKVMPITDAGDVLL